MKKLFVSGAALLPAVAFAEVPAAVTSALTAAQADAVTVAGTVIGIIVAIAAFLYMRKAIR